MKVVQVAVTAIVFLLSAISVAAKTVDEAAEVELTAYQTVVNTTDRVMDIIKDAQAYYDQDPERFYQEIEKVLNDVVDFDNFAWNVMGVYGSKNAYLALHSDEEKAAFKARITRFAKVFRDGLVQTYAKGLLAFDGNKIEVLEPDAEAEAAKGGSLTIVQHIYGEAEKPYVVQYTMKLDRAGEWKLRNVIIESINLGLIYQSQFASAAKLYNDDIDMVIDNWSVDPSAEVVEE